MAPKSLTPSLQISYAERVVDSNLLTAVITSITTAGSTAGVAIVALVLNNKRFDLIEKRLDRIDVRLDGIERDLKEFYKLQAEHSTDIARMKDRLDLK